MKKLNLTFSFIFLMFLVFESKGQLPTDPETKKVTYQETVPLDTLTKDELYEKSLEWMTNYFKTNKFDVNEKANYKIGHEGNFIVTYTYDFKYKSENTVTFNFTINQKDGKYRYTLSDFRIYDNKTGPKTAQPLEAFYLKLKTETKKDFSGKFTTEVNKLIEDLKTSMAAAKKEDKDDW